MTYEQTQIQTYFDICADQEWSRLTRRPSDEVSQFVHLHYLKQFILPGQRVLEVGAGPGRFTIELARLGATIVVADLSAVQLELNAQHVRAAHLEHAVTARVQLDVTDLSCFPDASFDAVVCYGGVLSYVFDQAPRAARELLRAVRPNGPVLISVMSRLYNLRKQRLLKQLPALARHHGLETLSGLMLGRDYGQPLTEAPCLRLYTARELADLFEPHGASVVAWSAVNCLAADNDESLAEIRRSEELWPRFLDWEVELGRQPGALETGHHLLAVVQRGQLREQAPTGEACQAEQLTLTRGDGWVLDA